MLQMGTQIQKLDKGRLEAGDFSDETHMFVQGQRSQHVQRSQNEKIRNAHIDQRVKHPQKKMLGDVSVFMALVACTQLKV